MGDILKTLKSVLYIAAILMIVWFMLVSPILAIGRAYDLGYLSGVFLSKKLVLMLIGRFLIGFVNGIYE